jgi:hypothetical protein
MGGISLGPYSHRTSPRNCRLHEMHSKKSMNGRKTYPQTLGWKENDRDSITRKSVWAHASCIFRHCAMRLRL